MPQSDTPFDFEGFKRAFVAQNIEAWIAYYAEDAEWIEYNHHQPLDRPQRTQGKAAILEHLRMIKDSNLTLTIEDEILGADKASFRVWVRLSSGKLIVEHTVIYYRQDLIYKMVDVEAWD